MLVQRRRQGVAGGDEPARSLLAGPGDAVLPPWPSAAVQRPGLRRLPGRLVLRATGFDLHPADSAAVRVLPRRLHGRPHLVPASRLPARARPSGEVAGPSLAAPDRRDRRQLLMLETTDPKLAPAGMEMGPRLGRSSWPKGTRK